MSVSSVNNHKMSTGAKIALGVGTAAAVGATALAFVKGKNLQKDEFARSAKGVVKAVGAGYKKIGKDVFEVVKPALNKVKSVFSEVFTKKAAEVDNKVVQ